MDGWKWKWMEWVKIVGLSPLLKLGARDVASTERPLRPCLFSVRFHWLRGR